MGDRDGWAGGRQVSSSWAPEMEDRRTGVRERRRAKVPALAPPSLVIGPRVLRDQRIQRSRARSWEANTTPISSLTPRHCLPLFLPLGPAP
jgi:hypothetical protein